MNTTRGIVIKSTGSWYTVLAESTESVLQARLRGALRTTNYTSTAPVVVGDWVELSQNATSEWVIDSVENRRNYLVRRSTNLSRQKHIIAANIDRLYLVATLASPPTAIEFIDRVLVGAECFGIPATILINKSDIAPASEYFLSIYRRAGYQLHSVSATTGFGIDELRDQIMGQTVLFSGNSGVGKSSLINAIDPTISARTGAISTHHGKGRHTTTFSEIFPLLSGGRLIDTPGIKGFGLVDVAPEELYYYFPEIMLASRNCSFHNCTHTHEPGCAVVSAIEEGFIAEERYESYLKMMNSDEKYR